MNSGRPPLRAANKLRAKNTHDPGEPYRLFLIGHADLVEVAFLTGWVETEIARILYRPRNINCLSPNQAARHGAVRQHQTRGPWRRTGHILQRRQHSVAATGNLNRNIYKGNCPMELTPWQGYTLPRRNGLKPCTLKADVTAVTCVGSTAWIMPMPQLKVLSIFAPDFRPGSARLAMRGKAGMRCESFVAPRSWGETRGRFWVSPPPVICATP